MKPRSPKEQFYLELAYQTRDCEGFATYYPNPGRGDRIMDEIMKDRERRKEG